MTSLSANDVLNRPSLPVSAMSKREACILARLTKMIQPPKEKTPRQLRKDFAFSVLDFILPAAGSVQVLERREERFAILLADTVGGAWGVSPWEDISDETVLLAAGTAAGVVSMNADDNPAIMGEPWYAFDQSGVGPAVRLIEIYLKPVRGGTHANAH